METEELPHALAPGAAAPVPAVVAGGEVADEMLEAAAGGEADTGGPARLLVEGPHICAALREDVLQALHRLAKLHVYPLLLPLPPPPSLPLPS